MNSTIFDGVGKTAWREANLAFIREYAPRDKQGKLLHGYVELLGDTNREGGTTRRPTPEMFSLLQPMLREPRLFVGVDNDPVVIYHHMLNARPFRAVYGNFFTIANREIDTETHAAIFNYDGTAWLGSPAWWEKDGRNMRETVQRSLSANGVCLFIVNLSLTRRGDPITRQPARLVEHTEEFLRLFRDMNPPPAKAFFDGKIPPEVGNRSRMAGAYHLYRSEGRPTEMATLRVVFRRDGLRIHNQCRF